MPELEPARKFPSRIRQDVVHYPQISNTEAQIGKLLRFEGHYILAQQCKGTACKSENRAHNILPHVILIRTD